MGFLTLMGGVSRAVKKLQKNGGEYYTYLSYSRQFKQLTRQQGFPMGKAEGEDEYINKWKQLSDRVEPWSYRFFSHYVGPTPYIVPENIGHTVIEQELCPIPFREYYNDKNMFPHWVPQENLPATIACRIQDGVILATDMKPIGNRLRPALEPFGSVILKPSVGTCSGIGVMRFTRHGDLWSYDKNPDIILTEKYLLGYGDDFVLQEALTQHPDLAKFNPTSANTLRIAVYRSVVDDAPHVVSAVLRIGKRGEFVDNVHAGGISAGINLETGRIDNFLMDINGNRKTVWNDIDFASTVNFVPSWQQAKALAEDVASRLSHMRLIAFDISIDHTGRPRLIEFNIDGFSFWIFALAGQLSLGDYTDEIIDYCRRKRNR